MLYRDEIQPDLGDPSPETAPSVALGLAPVPAPYLVCKTNMSGTVIMSMITPEWHRPHPDALPLVCFVRVGAPQCSRCSARRCPSRWPKGYHWGTAGHVPTPVPDRDLGSDRGVPARMVLAEAAAPYIASAWFHIPVRGFPGLVRHTCISSTYVVERQE